jgi:hypothetical protein
MRACEDWDMWRRVVLDHRIAYLDEGLMRGRVHNQNMSSNRWLMRRQIFKHLLKMSFELPADLRRSLVFAWHYWTIYFVFDCLNSVTGDGLAQVHLGEPSTGDRLVAVTLLGFD